jgi:hypothetical protein
VIERLRARNDDIAGAIFARVREVDADPGRDQAPELVEGLRKTVFVALDYTLETIGRGQSFSGAVPLAALEQVRRAARSGITLNTVLRRYIAGHAVFWDFVLREVDRADFSGEERTALLRQASLVQASFFEGLVGSVADEYMREVERSARTREQRRAELVQELLSGAIVSTVDLGYDVECVHLGLVASGTRGDEAVRRFAVRLGCESLASSRDEQTFWAWLGSRRDLFRGDWERVLREELPDGVSVSTGEPGGGVEGFRTTHQQACAAYRVAQRICVPVTRYRDVALVALGLDDHAMGRSLIDVYLGALDDGTERTPVLRDTLRAYFAAEQNASSAAAALGVHKNTVVYRLHTIERRLRHPVNSHRAELETALKLEQVLCESDSWAK